MVLANPASYLSFAAFKAQPNDYDLATYSDAQLTDLLVRASGRADSIMRKSYLATEKVVRYIGDGSNQLNLMQRPLLYVKRAQIVSPVASGTAIPTAQLLLDYNAGLLTDYTPLLIQGVGYFATFPAGIPVDVTLAYGYGFTVSPPAWSSADAAGGGLAPGVYDVAVTAKTMWGETTAAVRQVTTATGSFLITPTPVLGAYVYRAFIAPHGTTPLVLTAESPYTAYGTAGQAFTVNSLTPPNGMWPDALPATDTSAAPVPAPIIEAVRLLALDMLWAQNNPANRGVAETQSGRKSVRYRSTEGNSGRGVSYTRQEAETLLEPYRFRGIY